MFGLFSARLNTERCQNSQPISIAQAPFAAGIRLPAAAGVSALVAWGSQGKQNHATRNHILWGWFPCQDCLLSHIPAAPSHLGAPLHSSGILVHVLFNSTRSCWPNAHFSFQFVLFNPELCFLFQWEQKAPLDGSCSQDPTLCFPKLRLSLELCLSPFYGENPDGMHEICSFLMVMCVTECIL